MLCEERRDGGGNNLAVPIFFIKRSLVLQSLGAAALVLHGADKMTLWVEMVSGLY